MLSTSRCMGPCGMALGRRPAKPTQVDGATSPVLDTVVAITAAFTRAGIVFLNDEEPGVKLRAGS